MIRKYFADVYVFGFGGTCTTRIDTVEAYTAEDAIAQVNLRIANGSKDANGKPCERLVAIRPVL